VTHRWLPRLTSREVAEEVRRSRDDLEDLLGTPIRSFAYPMGGWTAQIRDEVERAGYDVALTVDRGRNLRDQDPVSLRRAFAFDRPTDLRRQLEGAFTWMRPIENRRRRREPAW
jgi:peptidoglycan/xylan/chitin deacetylase (PgdA/CDA1 family)